VTIYQVKEIAKFAKINKSAICSWHTLDIYDVKTFLDLKNQDKQDC